MQHTPGNTAKWLQVPVGSLKIEDIYREDLKSAPTRRVEAIWHSAPGCPAHSHVNNSMCYDSGTDVWILSR